MTDFPTPSTEPEAPGDDVRASRRRGRPRAFDREHALRAALKVFWDKGYEPTSVSQLCAAMGINSPSLYATFGSKAGLFLEAVRFYEVQYWDAVWTRMSEEPDVHTAISAFFEGAADVLSTPDAPCGCLVVLGAINVAQESVEVGQVLKVCRSETCERFRARLAQGVADGQLPDSMSIDNIARALTTLLQGLSIQAKDSGDRDQLRSISAITLSMLPTRP